MARWNSCNVLMPGSHSRQLWQFGGGKFNLVRTETRAAADALPDKLVAKDWQTLFQPRLNIAWVASDKVFLRVLQLPKADADETRSMVDLQLEKISPLPVAQIVWSFEVVPMVRSGEIGQELQPHATGELQTVIVMMVARNHVEDYLGQLEGLGYVADRLEIPLLDQLMTLKIDGDGAWLFPAVGGNPNACLEAWWYGGVLQYVGILHLPEGGNRASALQEQLAQTAWAGETEGWITSLPKLKLVADEAVAAAWMPLFDASQQVEVVAPPATPNLAQVTARRVASNGKTTNLLPPEFSTRYKQKFVDHLWMRALGALVVLYLAGVTIYGGFAKFAQFRYNNLLEDAAAQGIQYTNTMRLKEEMTVLQDTLDLQYAALECYRAVAENLPQELTLRSIRFDQGRKVTYYGTASKEDRLKVLDLNEKMHAVKMRDQPLFAHVNSPSMNDAPGGGQTLTWSFACELKRAEGQ